ncbi:MAG: FAD-binding oxidoreductase [Colwellia sp.]|nr:FAD-binding oxidoreductase [Colwellia sp.]
MNTVTDITQFSHSIHHILAPENIITRYIQRFAYGGDASFYRLVPKMVISVENEQELVQILRLASQCKIPVTFRAAGTSLSGQAITDSVLIILSPHWNDITIHNHGKQITLQSGVIGGHANHALAPYAHKIGPDPASINSCKIGGIAANNASGMCCGVKNNSYHTLASINLVFADGSQLNTGDKNSCQQFLSNHGDFVASLMKIVADIKTQPSLVKKIQHKYRLKNTTGYGINALVDYQNPIDIISHLMIGSEGTLAFISDITYNTVAILPFKMAGFFIFDTMQTACKLVGELANESVDAVEIMDVRALNSVVEQIKALVSIPNILPKGSTALLIEFSANSQQQLSQLEQQLNCHIVKLEDKLIAQQAFSTNEHVIANLWKMRKGMFPAVGAVRASGTTVVIEDVAVPVAQLAQAVTQLHLLFSQFGYDEAIIFGHALAGNLHFVFTQGFDTQIEIDRYHAFMVAVAHLIAVDYQGSLKAEHGTGRNIAPFVELEWGSELYLVMKKLKKLFDPQGILNPGVIINEDQKAHLKHLKIMTKTDDRSSSSIIDKCIECGFCESVCPSLTLTLSPRQRIAVWRQISLLQQKRQEGTITKEQQQELDNLEQDYQYFGVDSCAATGLCGQQCPVGIDTGLFIKNLRAKANTDGRISQHLAKNFANLSRIARFSLNAMQLVNKVVGDKVMQHTFSALNKVSGNLTPKWRQTWPAGAKPIAVTHYSKKFINKVVYIPACGNRIFAADNKAQDQRAIQDVVISLLNKADIEVIIPSQANKLCCGMPWLSKGLNDTAKAKKQELFTTIEQYSKQGQWPVITDASPCALTLTSNDLQPNIGQSTIDINEKVNMLEVTQFIAKYVLNKLTIKKANETFMLHTTCSSKKMDEGQYLQAIAYACSDNIIIPNHIYCCGFAGDKGFYHPELNKAALAPLKAQVPNNCHRGLSNSRTCEIGLSEHSGISYQSVLYLLDQCSHKKLK